jgi:GNAT superfamily N-acetyltransferase
MTSRLFTTPFILSLMILLTVPFVGLSQSAKKSTKAKSSGAGYGAKSVARDREIAATFAPVFYQGIGDHPRADLITNFDFDGDWRGDNNWAHADDKRFRMLAYVYYAVSETPTHFFIHYAVFHARDYKGDGIGGHILSEAIREGVRAGGRYDPTGLSSEAVLAHENDMEGCLVVASKSGEDPARARVVYVETLGHDRFQRYAAEGADAPDFKRFTSEGNRPLLYVEPKGHGVSAYDDERRAKDSSSKDSSKAQAEDAGGARERKSLVYRYAGRAGDAEGAGAGGEVGYELLSLYTTLWPRARRGANETFGVAQDFGALSSVAFVDGGSKASSRRVTLGKLGAAFLGKVGAPNAARPPWGWFDRTERDVTPGSWFFDPAATVKRDFRAGDDFSLAYTHAPFLGVFRR